MSEQTRDAVKRPTNKELACAVDWLCGGDDIDFDSADWSGANDDGIVTTAGEVQHEDGKHYIQVKWQIVGVDYDPNPIDEEWDR